MILTPYRFGIGPGTIHNGTTQTAASTSFGTGFTELDRSLILINGRTVYSIGLYSSASRSVTAKIALQNSTTAFDFVISQAFSHPGGGWADCILTVPYVVPDTGIYITGWYVTGTIQYVDNGTARSHKATDVSGSQTGFTASSDGNLSTRWTEGTN